MVKNEDYDFKEDKELLSNRKLSENDEELLNLIKLRIVRSYRWREDINKPLAKFFNISNEEFEEIMMKNLDTSSLNSLHASIESSKKDCLMDRLHVELRLCILSDVLKLITAEQSLNIKNDLSDKILNGLDFDDAIDEGKEEILFILNNRLKMDFEKP